MSETTTTAAVLEDIYRRHGEVSPAILVAEAADPEHPLHSRFEWDDTVAGHQYRLIQGGHIIRQVEVTIDRDQTRVRAWVAVRHVEPTNDESDDSTAGRYVPIQEVAADPGKRSAYEMTLRREWQTLKRKAAAVSGFLDYIAEDIRQEAS